jgi:GNAT superfamily N-acetyltransferase
VAFVRCTVRIRPTLTADAFGHRNEITEVQVLEGAANDADNVGRLRHVYVDTSARSRGIAACLVSACLAQTGEYFCVVRLSTLNPAAARLYEQLGFERFSVEGERRRMSFVQGELACDSERAVRTIA